jgi:hypothetical protein
MTEGPSVSDASSAVVAGGALGIMCLKTGSARQGSLVIVISLKLASFVISDDSGSEVSGVRLVAHRHEAGEDIVARCAAQEPNVCDGERHRGLESSMVPYENNLIAKVNGVSASVIVELLALVLRQQKVDRARQDIISVVHLQGLLLARIVED